MGPLIVLLAAIVAGRVIAERALRRLSTEEKATLLDGFSVQRVLGLVPLLVFVVVVVLIPGALSLPVIFALLLVYFLAMVAFSVHKLRRLSLPASYTRSYVISQAVQLAGILAYFASLTALG